MSGDLRRLFSGQKGQRPFDPTSGIGVEGSVVVSVDPSGVRLRPRGGFEVEVAVDEVVAVVTFHQILNKSILLDFELKVQFRYTATKLL